MRQEIDYDINLIDNYMDKLKNPQITVDVADLRMVVFTILCIISRLLKRELKRLA